VSLGDPHPWLKWLKDGQVVDETYVIGVDNTITNELVVNNLNRSNLKNEFTCLASNSHLVSPRQVTISLDLTCNYIFLSCLLK